jgi:mannose-6-phosphate isomerase-like protein (cupin superfamily)
MAMAKAAAETPRPQIFDLKIPLLKKGRSHKVVARTDIMSVAMKCYAEGGENTLHTHLEEDHVFVVLDGRARFYDGTGKVATLGKHQAILAPKGWYYRFETCGDQPLVILRFGAYVKPSTRVGLDGREMPPDSVENKHQDPVLLPGAYFE